MPVYSLVSPWACGFHASFVRFAFEKDPIRPFTAGSAVLCSDEGLP